MSDRNDQHQALRQALLSATLPFITESINLCTDAIKELRAELENTRLTRAECNPLERRLRIKQLEAELQDFDLDRAELAADRAERQEEREATKEERDIRLEGLRTEKRRRDVQEEAQRHVNGADLPHLSP